jgi:CRP/FNR family transcriptional regulator, cyclic AMP receptor protein
MPTLPPIQSAVLGLRGIRLLEGLDTIALEGLAAELEWRHCHAGQQVITRNATDRDVYLVVSGKVQVVAFSASGRQITYREMGAGDHFGELAAIDGRSRSADVIALEESLLGAMSPATFRALLVKHEALRERMLRGLVSFVREMTDRVFDLSTLGVRNRVHAELLRLARRAGVAENIARITPAPRHGDIASRVSTYREQVTRELSTLTAQGLIAREANCLVVTDVELLENMVADVRHSP